VPIRRKHQDHIFPDKKQLSALLSIAYIIFFFSEQDGMGFAQDHSINNAISPVKDTGFIYEEFYHGEHHQHRISITHTPAA
jgi:hypothetical protein